MVQPQVMGSSATGGEESGSPAASDLSEIVAEGSANPSNCQPPVRNDGLHARQAGVSGARQQDGGQDRSQPTANSANSFFQRNSQGEAQLEVPTRESLGEQGIHGVQADAMLVRMHEREFLTTNFRRWIQCFSLIVCLLTPAMLGITIWMMVEYAKHRGDACDVPLQMWCMVVLSIVVFNATLNRPGRTGSLMERICCLWEPDPQAPRPPPMRVRLYNSGVALFIFGWNLFGLYLVMVSGNVRSDKLPCFMIATGLYDSVKVYVAVNLTFTLFFYVNMMGFSRVLGIMLRRGLIPSGRAAPKGTLESGTEKIMAGDPVLKEQGTCSVCLDDYDSTTAVVRVKACGHVFHRQCLQGWLNVNRNCPVCRRDLIDPAMQA